MPTVLRRDGFRFVIYLNEHEPPHVHVFKGEKQCKVELDPVEVVESYNYNPRELNRIVALATTERDTLLKAWRDLMGG